MTEARDGIAIITVNRPGARNALNWSAQQRFYQIVNQYSADPQIRVMIITGAGSRAFVSGGDIKELVESDAARDGERLQQVMSAALEQLDTSPFAVVAAINGDAVGGGCEILTACDIRITVPHAQFRFAQASLGLTTGWGGTGRLVRLIGQSKASDWLLTGRKIDVTEAQSCGFVNYIVPEGASLMDYTMDIAQTIAKVPPAALSATKSLLKEATSQPLAHVNMIERRMFNELWQTDDRLRLMRSVTNRKS